MYRTNAVLKSLFLEPFLNQENCAAWRKRTTTHTTEALAIPENLTSIMNEEDKALIHSYTNVLVYYYTTSLEQ